MIFHRNTEKKASEISLQAIPHNLLFTTAIDWTKSLKNIQIKFIKWVDLFNKTISLQVFKKEKGSIY